MDGQALFISVGRYPMQDGLICFIYPKNHEDEDLYCAKRIGQYLVLEFVASMENFFTLKECVFMSNLVLDPDPGKLIIFEDEILNDNLD
eukprot:10093925-Ditylum_brightwellii.AAC.1